MTNDSGKFKTFAELDAEGFWLGEGNIFTRGTLRYLPLYEGKMVQMYDHRAASVKVNPLNQFRAAQESPATPADRANPNFSPLPQYWVKEEDAKDRSGGVERPYLIAFKDVTASTNSRTIIASAIPFRGAGHNFPIVLPAPEFQEMHPCLLANLVSFALDYVSRQKIGGQNLTHFYLEQFPVIPPEKYEEVRDGVRLADFVRERVLELVYVAHDMKNFARALAHDGEPFAWDDERRLHLRCQLDALYFLLYNLTSEETGEILDTFPIVKRQDEAKYARKYRTKDLILNYRKAYAAGNWDARVRI